MDSKGIDYVAIAATVMLSILGCVDVIFSDGETAKIVAAGIVGYMARYYFRER